MQRIGLVSILILAAGACGGSQEPAAQGPGTPGEPATTEVKPIPEGFFTITPGLTFSGDVDAAVDFYVKAFGAEKRYSMPGPDGKVVHAEIKIGDSIVMLGSEMPEEGNKSPATLGGTTATLAYYVEDADAVWAQAMAAGAKPIMPLADQFWGDRYGILVDPFGHRWAVATHKEDLTPEQMTARAKLVFGGQADKLKDAEPGTPATSYKQPGFHSVTPGLVLADAAATIEFYKKALGAETLRHLHRPDGKVMYAEIKIGDSIVVVNDEMPEMGEKSPRTLGGTPVGLMIYVPDVDASFARAVDAGATVKMPLADMFWGDRFGTVEGPSGYSWGLATHKEDLTPEQIGERMKAQYGAAGAGAQ